MISVYNITRTIKYMKGSITDCDVTLVDSTLIIGKQIDIDRVRATILHQWKDIITRSGLTYELG